MRSVNRATLVGNVGQDPEVRTTSSGTKVANVSLATQPSWGDNPQPEWHRLVFWDKIAEVVEKYVSKGDRLYVEGRIQPRSYEKDGVTHYAVDIRVNELVMLGSGSGERNRTTAPTPSDDDLPF